MEHVLREGIVTRKDNIAQPVGNAIFSLYKLEHSTYSKLERKLKETPRIAEVEVNYAADIVQVKFDPTEVTSDEIRTIMKKLEPQSSSSLNVEDLHQRFSHVKEK